MLESLGAPFSFISLICSVSFWLTLVLSYFDHVAVLNISATRWLAILGTGILLAAVGAVLNFEKRIWVFALGLALVMFFFVMYVIGS